MIATIALLGPHKHLLLGRFLVKEALGPKRLKFQQSPRQVSTSSTGLLFLIRRFPIEGSITEQLRGLATYIREYRLWQYSENQPHAL